MSQHHIVALGSSFAAGPGIPDIIDKKALRSSNNYAHQLAGKLNAKLTDLSISGATLQTILDQPQKHAIASPSRPQLEDFPSDATIVTLTAGGNDMGYIAGLILDGVAATFRSLPLLGYLVPARTHEGEKHVGVDEVAERFVKVIDRVKVLAPAAEIYLIDYLTVLGPDAAYGPENPLTATQIRHHQRMGRELSRAYEAAVALRPQTKLVKMEESKDHGVGSSQPWMVGYTMSMLWAGLAPYHPNLQGHEAIAQELYSRIVGS